MVVLLENGSPTKEEKETLETYAEKNFGEEGSLPNDYLPPCAYDG